MSSPADPAPRLSLHRIRKSFGTRTVLDGLTLDVQAGSVVLLTGRNGSGKTTLLRCVAGLAAYEGRIILDGRPWAATRADRQRLGYLPQALGLPEWASVAEVLTLFARLRGTEPSSLEVPHGFLPPPDQMIDALSGGQRQRVAICVALLGRPDVLLLDEPAANLDESGRDDLCTILAAERARGVSVLVAAPSAIDLNRLPDRTVHLRDGRVVDAGTVPRPCVPTVADPPEPAPPAHPREVAS